jgi:superfamily II DNA or RNA helicase
LAGFNNKDFRILIGSTIIGEGIDIRSSDHLIMAQGGKSEIAVTQAIGRVVRLFPGKKIGWLHDFSFEGTKYLQGHLVERIKVYENNFGATIDFIEG